MERKTEYTEKEKALFKLWGNLSKQDMGSTAKNIIRSRALANRKRYGLKKALEEMRYGYTKD